MSRAEELYWRWHEIFNDTMLPVLMTADQPKWYNHDNDLKDGDVVYFRKYSSAIRSPWSMGLVDAVDIGRDGLIRHVTVKYFNPSKPNVPQRLDRAVRSLVTLFNVDELSWTQDMDRIKKICKETNLPLVPNGLIVFTVCTALGKSTTDDFKSGLIQIEKNRKIAPSCDSYWNILCSLFYTLNFMHCILCIVFYALYSMP